MSILEILEAHHYQHADFTDAENRCKCGHQYGESIWPFRHPREMHHTHVAQVLEEAVREREAVAWTSGVDTALNHAIQNPDGITLRLEHLDGRPWANPYRMEPNDD